MGEVQVARLGEIALKNESTKGTKVVDANLVDGTNSKFRVYGLEWEPDIQIHERATARATLSQYPHLVGQCLARIKFDMEIRKTAVTATEDAWGNILRAAGCAFNSGTGVYSPSSDQSAHRTLTMYAWLSSNGVTGVRVGIRGAMGNVTLMGKVGQPLMARCEFWGVHDRDDVDGTPANTFALKPTDDALNTITHEAGIPAIFQGVGFTVGGTARVLSSFEMNFGNTVVPREDVGSDEGCLHYVVTDRAPRVSIDPDLDLVAAEDWLTKSILGTEVALAWSLTQASAGGVNARTIAFAAPKAQIKRATPGNVNGKRVIGVEMGLNGNTEPGDNEWTLTITGS